MPDNKPVRLLRNAGVVGGTLPSYIVRPRNAMLLTSGNKCVAVFMDPNDSTAPAGSNGDGTNITKVYVYESQDRDVWTLINTLSVTNAMDKSATYDAMYACSIGVSNQVFIVYRATGGTLRCLLLNAGTYTLASDIACCICRFTTGMWTSIDLDSQQAPTGGVHPVVGIATYVTTGANAHMGYAILHRRSSDGVWLTESNIATDPGNRASRDPNQASMGAIKILNGSVANNKFRIAWAFNVLDTTTDQGFGLQTGTLDADNANGLTNVSTIYGYGATKNTTCRVDIPTSAVSNYDKFRQLDIFSVNDSGDFIIANTQFYANNSIGMYAGSYNFSGAQVWAPTNHGAQPSSTGVYPASWSNGILTFHYGCGGQTYAQLNNNGSWLGVYNFTNQGTSQPMVFSGAQYYHGTNSAGWNTRINEDFLAIVPMVGTGSPQSWYAFPLPPSSQLLLLLRLHLDQLRLLVFHRLVLQLI